jgi:hypothetical protein
MRPSKTLLTFFLLILNLFPVSAQDPFMGSEKIITRTYAFSDFSRISLFDLDGSTEIETGKTYSVTVSIREKYSSILTVNQFDGMLTIAFNYTKDNNKYINDPQIRVKITCPGLDSLFKSGNSGVAVNLFPQDFFFLSNEGNGPAAACGKVNELRLINEGNGTLNAEGMLAKTVYATLTGNGNIYIHAQERAEVQRNGNGRIVQMGEAVLEE